MLQERPATIHSYPPPTRQPAAARPSNRQNRQMTTIPRRSALPQPTRRPSQQPPPSPTDRHPQTAMHPRIPSTPISRKLSSSLVKRSPQHSQVRSAPPILKIPPNPANPASDNHRLRVELLAAVDTWSRPFKMGHMQDACGQHWPVSRLTPVFYHHNLPCQRCSPCPSASSADKKVLRCSSCPFAALRG